MNSMAVNVLSPKLPEVLDKAASGAFKAEASLEHCYFDDADLSGKVAGAISLDEVAMKKVSLTNASLDKLAALDVRFINCDFSAARCPEASFQRASISSGRMTGWDCSRGFFKDVEFTDCKLDLANFRFAKFTRVRFMSCVLTDADFISAELRDVSFEDCLLERTEFTQCGMKNVDLRTSQLIDLKGWQYLKGAIIDSVQLMSAAPYFANELGLEIID